MDFHLTKEQLLVRKMYRDFAENEVKPLAAEIDEEERFPMETVEKMAKLGMMGIYFPKEYGGAGADVSAHTPLPPLSQGPHGQFPVPPLKGNLSSQPRRFRRNPRKTARPLPEKRAPESSLLYNRLEDADVGVRCPCSAINGINPDLDGMHRLPVIRRHDDLRSPVIPQRGVKSISPVQRHLNAFGAAEHGVGNIRVPPGFRILFRVGHRGNAGFQHDSQQPAGFPEPDFQGFPLAVPETLSAQ